MPCVLATPKQEVTDACKPTQLLQVARRVKVLQPDSPLLNVRRVKGSAAEDKVASGMEVLYSITYTPEVTEKCHCLSLPQQPLSAHQ